MKKIKRGQIYYANLDGHKGSEQGGMRPVLILQNNIGNANSPTTIVAIITSRKTKAKLPTHYWLEGECGLKLKSMVELEQLRTIDKSRLGGLIGTVDQEEMMKINKCLQISLGL